MIHTETRSACAFFKLFEISQGLRVETRFIKATWKLRTYLRLPWGPLIAIRGNTTYDLNEDYKVATSNQKTKGNRKTLPRFLVAFVQVVRHSESWDVSALEAIGQIFVSAPEQRKGS